MDNLDADFAVKYLPTWLPGGKENQIAKEYKERLTIMHDKTYDFVKKQMARGVHQPSYVSGLLEKDTVLPGSEEEIVVKYSAGALYGGGADTVRSDPHNHHHISANQA